MIKSGLQKIYKSHKDYDFNRTFGNALQPPLPDTYSVSQNWYPDQNLPDPSFNPPVPALPYGCTEWTSCVAGGDSDQRKYNPEYLENICHANANGGANIRNVLSAVLNNGLQADDGTINKTHTAYFNINPQGNIDWFDAVRLAIYSTEQERRVAIIGSNFFPEWLQGGVLLVPNFDPSAPLHCWSVEGWTTINSEPFLQCNFLTGVSALMSRPIFNATMSMSYTGAFTLAKNIPGQIQYVDLNIVDRIVSYIRQLWNFS